MDENPDPLNLLLGGDVGPGEEGPTGGKKVRRRREKDPQAPKKPSSAMTIYIEGKKPAMKLAEPSVPTMEINRRLQAEWQNLPGAQRAEYSKMAADDKARYEEELRAYEAPSDSLLRPTKSGTRLQKDPQRPKKPKTAYLCFADRHRATLANENPGAGRLPSVVRRRTLYTYPVRHSPSPLFAPAVARHERHSFARNPLASFSFVSWPRAAQSRRRSRDGLRLPAHRRRSPGVADCGQASRCSRG